MKPSVVTDDQRRRAINFVNAGATIREAAALTGSSFVDYGLCAFVLFAGIEAYAFSCNFGSFLAGKFPKILGDFLRFIREQIRFAVLFRPPAPFSSMRSARLRNSG